MCLWPCWWRMNKLRRLEAFAVSPLWSLDISWCVLYDCVIYFHYTRRVTSKHGVRSKSDCRAVCKYCFLLQSCRHSSLRSSLTFRSPRAGPNGDHSSSVSGQLGRQNSRSFQLEKTNSGKDPRGPHGCGNVQGTCYTIGVVATDWKRHKITRRQLPTLPGEAAIPGQWTPPTINTPRQTLSEGRHWHLWVPKQALPGAGGLLLKVYWRHIPAQLDISNGDREIKELFLPSWRSRDSCFRQRYPVLLGRVPYFCGSVELQPCHQQSPLSSKQWCCGASGDDRQRDPQAGWHLPCPFVLLLNPHSWPRS